MTDALREALQGLVAALSKIDANGKQLRYSDNDVQEAIERARTALQEPAPVVQPKVVGLTKQEQKMMANALRRSATVVQGVTVPPSDDAAANERHSVVPPPLEASVRYAHFSGALIQQAAYEAIRAHPLYVHGDAVLVWVNESDIRRLGVEVPAGSAK